MLRKLDGTSLVDVDMTRADADDALVLVEHGVDGGGVGLRAARQEEYLRVGHADSLADTVLGTVAELIKTVGRGLGTIVLHKLFEHLRVRPVVVVAFK